MAGNLIYLSIPGLRLVDVADAGNAPTLHRWASGGVLAELAPSFPCVTSTVQASTWTGVGPHDHGVIANGFYHRDRRQVEFWVGRNDIIQAPQIWDAVARAGLTSAVWHAQNIKDAAADFIVTPEPIHQPDGTTKLWCYSKPDGLYQRLLDELGHFPLQHYWGPLANIESSRWILNAAQWLIREHRPNFQYIYLPHLDYAAQKHGPDSVQAHQAVKDLDALLAAFDAFIQTTPAGQDTVVLAVSEYALTPVNGCIFPNRLLAADGLLKTHETSDGIVIDFGRSAAFAMVDHQCAHIYADPDQIRRVVDLFAGLDGIDAVHAGRERGRVGLDHPRSGEVIVVARPDHWFAYYWWEKDGDAPPFARTVDIHRKPGYDPVELFFDPATRSIPLDASLVRGSHGAPPGSAAQRGALICSIATPYVVPGRIYSDTDVFGLVSGLLGIPI
ncbi:MAG: alkaline phosphatase family protein [Phycisphaerales bacterium]|nr:alkaline phosphatase family protein [Phycisphaerales bacterium]